MRFKDFEIETNWERINVIIRCVHFELFLEGIYFWLYSQMRYSLVQTSGKRYLRGIGYASKPKNIYKKLKKWDNWING